MHTIQTLRVQFDTTIEPYEIPAFRGAVISKVGTKNTWLFHNHIDTNHHIYRYPLIQYKCITKEPAIVCLGEGVTAIQKLFGQPDWTFQIGRQRIATKISHLSMNEFTLQVTEEQGQQYKILNWMALNQKRYQEYKALANLHEQITLLENILTANILSMAKGIGWHISVPIQVKIQDITNTHFISFKKQQYRAFNLQFSCNVALPPFWGLGRNVSIGFGALRNIKA